MTTKLLTEITKQFSFEAAHRLPMVPPDHKCFAMHGHSFRVEITVRGTVDPKLGWICDFAALTDAWKPLHAVLDHKTLNDVEGLENPTSENLAAWVYARFSVPGARIAKVQVAETCTSSCAVYPEG